MHRQHISTTLDLPMQHARPANGTAYMVGFSFGLDPSGEENFLTPLLRMDLSECALPAIPVVQV